ncbi:MAG: hypothetical protein NT120_04720 [Candidatus Aenigmarchaeota archaeon]|nr:hypothetical protein [Candidatus Aenigmarchaeota archaeon]
MPKTAIYLPDSVHKAAKEAHINVSKTAREAILDKLACKGVEIEIPEPKVIVSARCLCRYAFNTSSLVPTCPECKRRFRLYTKGRSRIAGIVKGTMQDLMALRAQKKRIRVIM